MSGFAAPAAARLRSAPSPAKSGVAGDALQRPGSYTTGKVAERLRVSADTVRRHWSTWSKVEGFPKPLPLGSALLRWNAAAVETWLAARGSGGASTTEDVDTTDWAAIARARGLALDRGENPDGAPN